MNNKILITSALPYVNNIPHLGNIIGCVLSADVYARFKRLVHHDVLFICGTDEYGSTTETKAKELNMTPRQLCDKYHQMHKQVYDWFDISFDIFGRTSTDNPKTDRWEHTEICHEIFEDLVNNGLIIEKRLKQLFCVKTNRFLADRYVKGTCPFCGYTDANGDQCDSCGKLYCSYELINPYCKNDKEAKLIIKESDELFLALSKSKIKKQLVDWWLKQKKWSHVANNITKNWLNDKLLDRCITRDLDWGTPVPNTDKFGDKYQNKVFYVWFDAPIGYMSIIAKEKKNWKDWWMNDFCEIIQFMAKDNVPFHSIMFPATLMNTGRSYNLVNKLQAIDYLKYNDTKFSKSNNIGVFGDDVMRSGINSDIWRFYLLKIRPENGDSNFKWNDFQEKVNSELVDNFSNLVNRILSMSYKYFGIIPAIDDEELFNELNKKYKEFISNYIENFENFKFRSALNDILKFSTQCNIFLHNGEPWKMIKPENNPKHAQNVLGVACHFLIYLSVVIEQFLPKCADKIQDMMNINFHDLKLIEMNHFSEIKLNKPEIIFRRITDVQIERFKTQFG